MRTARKLVLSAPLLLLAACATLSARSEPPREVMGLLSNEGRFAFIPCEAGGDDSRWRVQTSSRAAEQLDHIRNTGLLSLPRPLLVSVTAHVSNPFRPETFSGGYTRTITVIDFRGMQPSGTCASAAEERFTPIS